MRTNADAQLDVRAMNDLARLGDYVTPIAVRVMVELGVPDQLADGPRSADEIAEATGSHAPSLYRVMRALTATGVFHETRDHRFELTSISDLLRSDHPYSMRGMYHLAVADIQA